MTDAALEASERRLRAGHRDDAERLLREALKVSPGTYRRALLAEAQVHATLALFREGPA